MIPLVSVILPAYNAESFITETIQSILNQTYQNFELIVINDASTDNTESAVNSFNDSRIKYFANSTNLKLIKTLNKGISLSKGKYIARIDADDICHPRRLELQVTFLTNNPDIAVVGTDIYLIDKSGLVYGRGVSIETRPNFIKWSLQRRCCLYHPSVMFNKQLVGTSLYYDEKFINAEDYELWLRLTSTFKIANIHKPLVFYRIHNASISQTSNQISVRSMLLAIESHSKNWHIKCPDSNTIRNIRFPNKIDSNFSQNLAIEYLLSAYNHFSIQNSIDQKDKSNIKESVISFYIITSFSLIIKFQMPSLEALTKLLETKPGFKNFYHIFSVYMINIHRRFLWKYLYRKKIYSSFY